MPPIAHEFRLPVHHGVSLTDDYGWLRAENWQEVMRKPALLDAGIRAHLEAKTPTRKRCSQAPRRCRRRCFKK